MLQPEGRTRVVVERVRPEIDCGAFPAKRIIGESVVVEADIFTDGHDLVVGELLYRHVREEAWRRQPMKLLGNDRWRGEFPATELGRYQYTVEGWIDRFGTWRSALVKRINSGQDVRSECLINETWLRSGVTSGARGRHRASRLGSCARRQRPGHGRQ
jgi:starch synthase (maltosyl-transferring)